MKQFRELFRKRWFIAFLTALITVVSILDPFTATSVYAAGDWIELSYHCLSEEDVGSDAVAEISEEEDDDGMSVHLQEVELVDGEELMAGQSFVMVLTFKVDGVPTDSNAQQVQTALRANRGVVLDMLLTTKGKRSSVYINNMNRNGEWIE